MPASILRRRAAPILAALLILTGITLGGCSLSRHAAINSLGMELIAVPAGRFAMGDEHGWWNERRARAVTISAGFLIAARAVSNAQFEVFAPAHARWRGRDGSGGDDDDPAVFVNWDEATAFCAWLSAKEGALYRLPSEAEWEWAARAPTAAFADGAVIENWCADWYGPYPDVAQSDPIGYASGDLRVTRGGPWRAGWSAANPVSRLADVPNDRNRVLGFRVVRGPAPTGTPLRERPTPRWARDVAQQDCAWVPPVDPSVPYFAEPIPFVRIPAESDGGPLFTRHNHDPALAWCRNGDLLAIWYSCLSERGRELAIAASRLRHDSDAWEPAEPFWDVPGRNDHAPALWHDGQGTLYHFNGLAVEGGWTELAVILRTSTDNGATWSPPRLIAPAHGHRHQPIPSVFQVADGTISLPCDALPGGEGGTVLHQSRDHGASWNEISLTAGTPSFRAGASGAWIAGIHAGVDAWRDGSLVAIGRGDAIDGHMPLSVSRDGGHTWRYSATPFPPIVGGERAALRCLREDALLLISFTRGSTFTDEHGRDFTGQGAFAALSFDGGATWPVRRLLSDGRRRVFDVPGGNGRFVMDATHAQPAGYLAMTQTPDGVIHLISSDLHYRFNLAWLRSANAANTIP